MEAETGTQAVQSQPDPAALQAEYRRLEQFEAVQEEELKSARDFVNTVSGELAATQRRMDEIDAILRPPKPGDLDMKALRLFTSLEKTKKGLESELKSTKDELSRLESQLLPQFEAGGMQNATVNGRVVYVHSQLWAGVAEGHTREELVEALKDHGMGDMVKENFNTQTLSAWLREKVDAEEQIAPELDKLIKRSEVFSLRSQQAR